MLATLQKTWLRRHEIVADGQRAKGRSEKLTAAWKQIEGHILAARKLVKLANTVQKSVITEVFNESLNRLWSDLFSRLVKVESFRITLQELKLVAKKLKVQFAATWDKQSFQQPGSILSSGNLNTAALSLFLALNLIEQPHHQVLVLDDPVQNLDDVHVVHLAEVLREIARATGRQLVLAVHDRPLFDYFCLELGPTRAGQSLQMIELDRDPVTYETMLRHEHRQWAPDELQFQ